MADEQGFRAPVDVVQPQTHLPDSQSIFDMSCRMA
ncbi:hypothetical protein X772_32195 [Mesorhizobium sp. LSJC280B00]|nr:hypothetical protein X772_32195 [Mesorhizobium sp. LSJC280B00]